MKVLHDCREELRVADLKATPARIAVMKLLEKTDKPLDVASILYFLEQQQIGVDEATIFRMMNVFTEKGITRKIQLNEGKYRYELSSLEDHHHLICIHCGSIDDISDCNIEALEREIKKKKQFSVKRHSLEFFGICRACIA